MSALRSGKPSLHCCSLRITVIDRFKIYVYVVKQIHYSFFVLSSPADTDAAANDGFVPGSKYVPHTRSQNVKNCREKE